MLEVVRTKQELRVVADFDVPLTRALGQMDDAGLRKRLAFERWFGALNEDDPDKEIVAEASANYALFSGNLKERLEQDHKTGKCH